MNFKELFICSKDVVKILFVFYFSIIIMVFSQNYFNIGNEDLMFGASLIVALCIYYCAIQIKYKNVFKYLHIKPIKFDIKLLSLIFSLMAFYILIESTIALLLTPETSHISEFDISDIFCVFHLIVLAPLVEEIIFRGLIFKRLQQCLNIYFSIGIQAILFGLMHHSSTINIVSATVFGVILAIIYYKSKNLTIPIALHSIHNLILVLVNGIILYFS